MSGPNPFDASVMTFIQENFHNPLTDSLFPIFTYLGECGACWILLALGLLFLTKRRRCGFLILCSLLVTLLVGEVAIKNLVCRPRPFQEFPNFAVPLIPPPSGFSFPSGHSASSFAAATVLFSCNKKWGVAALSLAALIAFSRIFLFVHYPTDVLAGALLGVLMALLMIWLERKFFQRNAAYEKHIGSFS